MKEGPQDPVIKARIALLFELAWLQPGKFRASFLQGIASGEPLVVTEVQRLLLAAEAENLGSSRNEAREWLEKRSGTAQPPAAARDPAPASHDSADLLTPDSTTSAASANGASFGDFEILRPLDEGGLGVAHLARQKSLGRLVTLKTYKPTEKESEASRKQFLRAAQQAARLQHPHIVTTYTAGIEGDTLYYVMEYVEGVTMQRVVEAFSQFLNFADDRAIQQLPADVRAALRIDLGLAKSGESSGEIRVRARQQTLRKPLTFLVEAFLPVVEAIEYAHRQGIVHGDIKPSNLLLDSSGRVLVLDFGLASSITMAQAEDDDLALTTSRYFSPEQVANSRLGTSRATDVYMLGATLYELIGLRPAYDGQSSQAIRAKIATESPVRLRELNPRIHGDLELIVDRAMHRQPRRRYASAAGMAADLKRFLQRQPLASGEKRMTRMVRRALHDHPFLAMACSLVVLGLAALGVQQGWSMWSKAKLLEVVGLALRNAQRSIGEAVAESSGRVDSMQISKIESHLDAARDHLRDAARHGVGLDGVAEAERLFKQQRLEIRVKSYCEAAEAQGLVQYMLEACQYLEDAKREGVDVSAAGEMLRQKRAVAQLTVASKHEGQLTCSIRRIDRRTKEVQSDALDIQSSPAKFDVLAPGGYVVRVSEPGHADISFPVVVEQGWRYEVTLPVRPATVPAGMVYVPCADHEVIMFGDHDTRVAADTFGSMPRIVPRSFFISRHEVTNGEFLEFLQASEHKEQLEEAYAKVQSSEEALDELSEEALLDIRTARPLGWLLGKPPEGAMRLPVRLRSVHDAVAYAWWKKGALLPTQEEWERAARGLDARVYPYGDEFDLQAHGSVELAEVASHPKDMSVYGVLDMLGSVKELVRPERGTSAYILRGRDHNESDPFKCRLSSRNELETESSRRDRMSRDGRDSYQELENTHLQWGFYHRRVDGYGFRLSLPAESPVWRKEQM